MDAFVFAAQVVEPVLVEVAVGEDGAEFEDGLGAIQSPPGPCDGHAVRDKMPAGALDDAGGDGPALGQGGGAVQVGCLGGQVVSAGFGAVALFALVAVGGGTAADPGGDGGGLAFQDAGGAVGDPGLGVGVAGLEERPGCFPEVLELSTVSARESYVLAGWSVVAIDVTLTRR